PSLAAAPLRTSAVALGWLRKKKHSLASSQRSRQGSPQRSRYATRALHAPAADPPRRQRYRRDRSLVDHGLQRRHEELQRGRAELAARRSRGTDRSYDWSRPARERARSTAGRAR